MRRKKGEAERIWLRLDQETLGKLSVLQLAIGESRNVVVERALKLYWRAMSKENLLVGLLRDDEVTRIDRE